MAVVSSTSDTGARERAEGRTSGGRRASDAPAGRPAASSLLEHSQNVVTEPDEDTRTFQVVKCGCDCWYCPDCCERKGYNLRAELIPVLETFTGLMMLTLTIDPQLFSTPQDAYEYVRNRRGISRLMRYLDHQEYLHTRRYFYVVEFQKKTEQAHFHVLIDATRVPKEAIDHAWSKLRPNDAPPREPNRPAFGMTRFSVPHFHGGAEHAGRYATKYLVKTPADGWPEWVMRMGKDKRVPRYQASRGLWNREPQPSNPNPKPRKSVSRTYAERIAECGEHSMLFELTYQLGTDESQVNITRRWLARLDMCEALIADLAADCDGKRAKLTLHAPSIPAAIRAIQSAAGQPIRIVSGLGVGGP